MKIRNTHYLTYNKRKRTINFVIVLIGVLAIMLTGFVYASGLKNTADYSYSNYMEGDNHIDGANPFFSS